MISRSSIASAIVPSPIISYQADTKDQAETALLELEEKWGNKYPVVIRSWNDNWDRLSTYFDYSPPIRRLIYTTNTVEGFHRQVRKVTKTKVHSPQIWP